MVTRSTGSQIKLIYDGNDPGKEDKSMRLVATIFAVVVLITPLYAKNYTREEVEETIKKVKIGENAGYQIISILKNQINSEDFSEMSMIIDKADPLMEAVGPAINIITMLLQNTPEVVLKYAIESFAEMDLKFNLLLITFEQVRDFFREEPMKAKFSRYTSNIFSLSRMLQGFFKGPVDQANFYKRSFMDWYEGVDWQVTEALIEGMRGGSDRSDNIPLAVLEFTDFNRRQTQHLMAGIIALFMENIKIHLAYHKFKGTGDEHAYKSYYVFMLEKIIHYALKLDREAYGQWHTDLSGVIESKLPSVKGTSNENTALVLFHFLREKYDWRDWLVVVYDDVFGSEKHWIKVCGGYFRFRQDGRNIFVASVVETSSSIDKNHTKKMLTDVPTTKCKKHWWGDEICRNLNAKEIYNELPAELREGCDYASVGVIEREAEPIYVADLLPDAKRLVTVTTAKFKIHAFR